MSQSFLPPEDTPSQLWLERSYFVGAFLGSVAYGVHCCIYFTSVYFLWKKDSRITNPHLIFVTIIFLLASVVVAAGIRWNEQTWIDDRNFPGGPAAYLVAEFSIPLNVLDNSAYVVNNVLTDLLVLYRCWVIWGKSYLVVAVPFLAILAWTVCSILTLVQTALPGGSLWTHTTYNFAVPYWSLSTAVNIVLTFLIVFRLLLARNQLRAVFGAEYAQNYTSLIAIIIESAAIYSVTSIIYLVAFARNSNVQNLVIPVLGQVMCISPELIVIRVAYGRAYSKETAQSTYSGIRFQGSQSTGITGSTVVASSGGFNQSSIALGKLSHGRGKSSYDIQASVPEP